MPIQDNELLQSFLTESMEMLDDAEPKLIDLQRVADSTGAVDEEMVNSIFRAFHSIKGSAGFLQLKNISAVTHEAETLLDRFRKGKTNPTRESIDVLFRACDVIRRLLGSVEETQSDEGCGLEVANAVDELSQIIMRGQGSNTTASAQPPIAPPLVLPSVPMTDSQKADMLLAEDEHKEPAAVPPPSPEMSLLASADMIAAYVQDAEELIENAEQAFLKVEKSPSNAKELIREALRALHTLKGNSGLMGMDDIGRLAHKLETLWQLVDGGTLSVSANTVKLSLQIMDVFRKTVTSIHQGGNGKIIAFAGFSDLLDEIVPAEHRQDSKPTTPSPAPSPAPSAPSPEPIEPAKSAPKAGPDKGEEKAPARGEPETGSASLISRSIRVSIDKLDQLNNLVGELAIAEAMVTHNSDLLGLRLDNFDRAAHQLSLITSEIQDISMSLRMIPVDATFKKMIRLVHDLSAKASKKVNLQMSGTETEVDRTVAELISDPLVHMVRNSIDHGLETPQERKKAGKPEIGMIHIEAKHQSGEVLIIIADDGRGLNRDKILKKGIERGLVAAGSTYRDEEIYNLIFEPGFSTADKITDVSGRGVGMDVVRKNIEKIRGRVEIHTEVGIGTTFTIHIPLTLAIIHGMLVQVGVERYIIPLLAIRESFQPESATLSTVVGRGEMISIRGELLPLYRISRLFNSSGAIERAEEGIAVVVEDGTARAALLVDKLLGQQQTVVKSLGDTFGQMDGISGASILSDGRVGLILDIAGVIKIATTDRTLRTR